MKLLSVGVNNCVLHKIDLVLIVNCRGYFQLQTDHHVRQLDSREICEIRRKSVLRSPKLIVCVQKLHILADAGEF